MGAKINNQMLVHSSSRKRGYAKYTGDVAKGRALAGLEASGLSSKGHPADFTAAGWRLRAAGAADAARWLEGLAQWAAWAEADPKASSTKSPYFAF